MKYSSNLPLSISVYLVDDVYSDTEDTRHVNVISATTLLKSTKQLILSKRAASEDSLKVVDASDLIARRMGTSIHDGIESAWSRYRENMAKLTPYMKPEVIKRIKVNPERLEDVGEDDIPIYIEKRSYRPLIVSCEEFTISGKFDFLCNGVLEDMKTTSPYTYISGNKDDQYILQASIYRWLNPLIVTEDYFLINFIFTNWDALKAKTQEGYPQSRIISKKYLLMSLNETEKFIRDKLIAFVAFKDVQESELPPCTDKELGRSASVYKYYADPTKLTRSTKNFSDYNEAIRHQLSKGKGIVIKKEGTVFACRYCDGFSLCTQKDEYIANGELVLD